MNAVKPVPADFTLHNAADEPASDCRILSYIHGSNGFFVIKIICNLEFRVLGIAFQQDGSAGCFGFITSAVTLRVRDSGNPQAESIVRTCLSLKINMVVRSGHSLLLYLSSTPDFSATTISEPRKAQAKTRQGIKISSQRWIPLLGKKGLPPSVDGIRKRRQKPMI
jgi:hypothetical protein